MENTVVESEAVIIYDHEDPNHNIRKEHEHFDYIEVQDPTSISDSINTEQNSEQNSEHNSEQNVSADTEQNVEQNSKKIDIKMPEKWTKYMNIYTLNILSNENFMNENEIDVIKYDEINNKLIFISKEKTIVEKTAYPVIVIQRVNEELEKNMNTKDLFMFFQFNNIAQDKINKYMEDNNDYFTDMVKNVYKFNQDSIMFVHAMIYHICECESITNISYGEDITVSYVCF